jgi:hypothetical protein
VFETEQAVDDDDDDDLNPDCDHDDSHIDKKVKLEAAL